MLAHRAGPAIHRMYSSAPTALAVLPGQLELADQRGPQHQFRSGERAQRFRGLGRARGRASQQLAGPPGELEPGCERQALWTYADGLARRRLSRDGSLPRAHGRSATITIVRPSCSSAWSSWKARAIACAASARSLARALDQRRLLLLRAGALDHLSGDRVLEREPLARLAADGELHAHRHEGFWECMDTYKDAAALNDLWRSGRAPWRMSSRPGGAGQSSRRARRGLPASAIALRQASGRRRRITEP